MKTDLKPKAILTAIKDNQRHNSQKITAIKTANNGNSEITATALKTK